MILSTEYRDRDAWERLIAVLDRREPVTVLVPGTDIAYRDMVLTDLRMGPSTCPGDVVFTAEWRQVRLVRRPIVQAVV